MNVRVSEIPSYIVRYSNPLPQIPPSSNFLSGTVWFKKELMSSILKSFSICPSELTRISIFFSAFSFFSLLSDEEGVFFCFDMAQIVFRCKKRGYFTRMVILNLLFIAIGSAPVNAGRFLRGRVLPPYRTRPGLSSFLPARGAAAAVRRRV